MTMRTLLTAAAIISSAVGVSKAPIGHSTYNSSFARLGFSSANTQLSGEFASLDQQETPLPPEPWAKADPADSLYRLAREAMSRGDYKRAADLFHQIPQRFPQSAYAGQAMYYEAYSLYRSGGDDDLSAARDRLNQLKQRDAKIWKNDGSVLLTRVCGELAKRGDEACAADIEKTAQKDPPAQTGKNCPDEDDENDDRIAALNALIQMDAERAMPILKKVLERRDPCSVGLREKAVFLVSQKHTAETANILMNVARSDPSQDVREAREGNLLAGSAGIDREHGIPAHSLLAAQQSGSQGKDSVLAVSAERRRQRAVADERRREFQGRHRAAQESPLLGRSVGRGHFRVCLTV